MNTFGNWSNCNVGSGAGINQHILNVDLLINIPSIKVHCTENWTNSWKLLNEVVYKKNAAMNGGAPLAKLSKMVTALNHTGKA